MQQFPGFVVVHEGADRNFQDNVFPFATGLVGAFTVASAFGLVFGVEAEMNQRIVALAGLHDDVATASAIAAPRTSARNEFLAAEGDNAVAAVSGLHANFGFIDKHRVIPLWQSEGPRGGEARMLFTSGAKAHDIGALDSPR